MNVFKKSFLELVGVVVVLTIVVLVLNFFSDEQPDYREIEAEINDVKITLEIADNSYLHSVGLSGRDSLQENHGMIFIYDDELEELSFWMKNTLIPLDIIFLNKDLEIVHIFENVPICEEDPCPQYTSEKKAQYVVELNAGWVEENGVKIGDEVKIINQDQSDS